MAATHKLFVWRGRPAVLAAATLALLAACTEPAAPGGSTALQSLAADSAGTTASGAAASPPDCPAEPGVRYLCGLSNAEDILRIGDTPWLLASGMAGAGVNGRLYLIDAGTQHWEVLFPGPAAQQVHDLAQYPDCPGPLDTTQLSLHGLALQNYPAGSGSWRLYMTSHGSREAIEIFSLDAAGKPRLQWIGCVPLPDTVWANSVEILPDGGFLATNFMDPSGAGFAPILRGERNGQVLEWHPGGSVQPLAGTELSGPNGIALSADGQRLFVAAFGSNAVVRYALDDRPVTGAEASLGVVPDNLRWTPHGTLLTAGANVDDACFDTAGSPCGPGWSVLEIDPDTLEARRLGGLPASAAMASVSTALLVDGELWAGTPRGELIAILPAP